MKRIYTFLLAGAVFITGVVLCFTFSSIDEGEHIIVQRENKTLPLRGGLPSTDGYLELLPGETLNINTADLDELMKLPGIGEVLAQRIIDYRNSHDPFRSIEEIMEVEDIGEGRFEKIKALIVTGSEK